MYSRLKFGFPVLLTLNLPKACKKGHVYVCACKHIVLLPFKIHICPITIHFKLLTSVAQCGADNHILQCCV
jgi:hypothetical protein